MKLQRNVLEYLDNSAARYAGKTAFSDEYREETFASFRGMSISVGTAVADRTGSYNKPIAVFIDRDLLCLAGMMGVLYSGNYYVPIDNKMPKRRIDSLFEKLNPELILYREMDSDKVMDYCNNYDLLSIEEALTYNANEGLLNERRSKVLDVDPVYVIHTSGSTGVPKGIVVSHRGVIEFTEWIAEHLEISAANIFGNQTPFYFDASVKDLYLTIKCAAQMHIIPQKLFSFPVKLMEYIDKKGVNTLPWATSAFNLIAGSDVLTDHAPKQVRKLIIGGESMRAKNVNIWRRAIPDLEIYNVYGPTEAVVDSAYYKVDRHFEDYEAIPIGKACENKEILLLDENLQPVQEGEPGEICIRGSGLAKGYFADEEKTNAVFIQNPLNKVYPDLIYKTGDIGKLNEYGEIIYQSRADGQIKHLGYRIELGEIERAVNSVEKIKNCACVFDTKEDKIICFYEGDVESIQITMQLKNIIPKYMFPNFYFKTDKMPYNATGKIDRLELRRRYESAENT